MLKSIMREIIIVLLLIVAILLVLGVFLYDYIPTNKVVPKIEQYQAPESIKEELQQGVNETEEQITPIIYEINSSDLSIYEKSKDYKKGKVNPFSDSSTNTVTGNGSNTDNTIGTNASANPNTNSNSGGGYLPNNGTK